MCLWQTLCSHYDPVWCSWHGGEFSSDWFWSRNVLQSATRCWFLHPDGRRRTSWRIQWLWTSLLGFEPATLSQVSGERSEPAAGGQRSTGSCQGVQNQTSTGPEPEQNVSWSMMFRIRTWYNQQGDLDASCLVSVVLAGGGGIMLWG